MTRTSRRVRGSETRRASDGAGRTGREGTAIAGETWRRKTLVGKEGTYGTAVTATYRTYWEDPNFKRERAPRPRRFATGTRDDQRAQTLGPVTASGQYKQAVSPDEMLEGLEMLFGAASVTTPTGGTLARRHTYTPGSATPSSATIEYQDGANLKRVLGAMVDKLTISGSDMGANDATWDIFAADYLDWTGPITSAPAERTPFFLEGWQTNVYLDAFSATPGTTLVSNAALNWEVMVGNNLGRKYFAQNTQATGALTTGELDVTAKLTLEASAALAVTEVANWDAQTLRMLRLEFLDTRGTPIEQNVNAVQTLTFGGSPSGNFTLTFNGQTTANIAWSATNATLVSNIDTALEALSNIGSGHVTTAVGTMTAGVGTITVTFTSTKGNSAQPLMTASAITGGTLTIATTTPGSALAYRTLWVDVPGAWSAVDLSGAADGTRVYAFSLNYVYNPSPLAAGIVITAQTDRTAAFA